jgi:hypothetical protein
MPKENSRNVKNYKNNEDLSEKNIREKWSEKVMSLKVYIMGNKRNKKIMARAFERRDSDNKDSKRRLIMSKN